MISKTVFTAIIIMVVAGAIVSLLPKLGMSAWVFMVLFFYFSAVDHFNIHNLYHTIVGGLVIFKTEARKLVPFIAPIFGYR